MQHLFPSVIYWLACHDAQTIKYVIVQTPDTFTQNVISWNGWNSQKNWTKNTQNFSTLQVFQPFSHKCKSLFLQSCPKEFIRFHFECKINLFKGNLQSIKKHHVVKFQNEIRLLSLKRTTWKQRRDILASEKSLQLDKVITPPVINHLSWFGAVYPRSGFCLQQKCHYPVCYKAGTPKVSTFKKTHVPSWFTWEGYKQKFIFQSRLLSRKIFVLSTFQSLKFRNFGFGVCWTTALEKRRRSKHLIYFTWRRWHISVSDSDSECQSWRAKKPGPFRNLKVRSCRGCTNRVVLLMDPCAT